jgi:cellulose biosynthesis protein BcsQ
MNTPILTFFNHTGGVGKTSLLYHLAWMFSDFGKRVIVADLDPQSTLTAAFLDDDTIEKLWETTASGSTMYDAVKPLTGVGDIVPAVLQMITDELFLIPGDAALSSYEDTLTEQWPSSMGDANVYRPMRILSSFWQVMQGAAFAKKADIILVDTGPNLGAINRSVLIAADYVVIPLGADPFSLLGLRHLGPTLRNWKNAWAKRLENWKNSREAHEHADFKLPDGNMNVIGYLTQQHSVRLDRPVRAYDKWSNRIPQEYRKWVLDCSPDNILLPENDPHCIATIKHYRSLVPMRQEVRKPIFKLAAADGAIGSLAAFVRVAGDDFRGLAQAIAKKIMLPL